MNKRLVLCAILFMGGAAVSTIYGNARSGSIDRKLVALAGVVAFIAFAILFLHAITNIAHRVIASEFLSAGRASTIRFVLRTVGYVTILLIALELLDIPIGRLLLGGAALGIILGVAAQQALANFFASIVLIITRPFTVGQYITLNSGALGGKHMGTVVDIGLTHTRLQEKNGDLILLPNATILSNAAIMTEKHEPDHAHKADHE